MQPNPEQKTSPLNIRIKAHQRRLIEKAAGSSDKTVSDFVRDVALREAEMVLLDRSAVSFADQAWADFTAALDAPPADNPRLRDLMRRPPLWEA